MAVLKGTAHVTFARLSRPPRTRVLFEAGLGLARLVVEKARLTSTSVRDDDRGRAVTAKAVPRTMSHTRPCPDVVAPVVYGVGLW